MEEGVVEDEELSGPRLCCFCWRDEWVSTAVRMLLWCDAFESSLISSSLRVNVIDEETDSTDGCCLSTVLESA